MEREDDHLQHDEAIVPVKTGLTRSSAPAEPVLPSAAGPSPLLLGGVAVVLVLAALVVIFLLPGWVEQARENAPAVEPAQAAAEPAAAPEPVLSEEEIADLTDRADALLAELLSQQQRLAALSAESWGEEDWERYGSLARTGDDAYLADSFEDAIAAYSEALDVGEALLDRSVEITARALAAGQRALEAGNAQLAIAQFDLVLGVEQDNEEAKAGRARAERLPEVLALVRQADELRQQEQLTEAADTYRAALAIDPAWTPAQGALDAVERRLAELRFEALMSSGYRALAEERYGDADEAFRSALAMRPGSAEAQDGMVQAEQSRHLDQIALAEARALAFERRELWQQAIDQYRAALATDDSLAFAKRGLERAQARADLDAKLANLIENPNLLLGDSVLASAQGLVEEARRISAGISNPSAPKAGTSDALPIADPAANARLDRQIGELSRLITLASTPVRVELRSDELTEVTLYRVGALGVFAAKEVELRPGNYTAVGSRDGYRDVRKTFTVLPGREIGPVSVVCMEPI